MSCICSWSGGKDSCFALIEAKKTGIVPAVLLNMLNEEGKISRSHGIPVSILQAQAAACNLPIYTIASSWGDYEKNFVEGLITLKEKYSAQSVVFGDIDLQEHRDWEEQVCNKAALTATLPLWHRNRKTLVVEMLNQSIETFIVSCNTTMGPSYIGRYLTPNLINELEKMGIDPCGETGEFHTLVTGCELFSSPIKVQVSEILYHNNYWFGKMSLVN